MLRSFPTGGQDELLQFVGEKISNDDSNLKMTPPQSSIRQEKQISVFFYSSSMLSNETVMETQEISYLLILENHNRGTKVIFARTYIISE